MFITVNNELSNGARECERYYRSPFIDAAPDQYMADPGLRIDGIFIPSHRESSLALERIGELASVSEVVCILATRAAAHSFQTITLPKNVRIVSENLINQTQERFLTRPSSRNASQLASAVYDLPAKRNLALQLARQWRLRRICLLDDDIAISNRQIQAASTVLSDTSPMAGFYVFDFPDVSTIDHIQRFVTGEPSQTIPGGNCLFLFLDQIDGYFPYIYNEDWIYVLHNAARSPGIALGEVKQSAHTPWHDNVRVRFEEFGETIISGLLELDQVLNANEAVSESFWTEVIRQRKQFLIGIHNACADSNQQIVVGTALGTITAFSGQDCVRFINAIRTELNDFLWLQDILRGA